MPALRVTGGLKRLRHRAKEFSMEKPSKPFFTSTFLGARRLNGSIVRSHKIGAATGAGPDANDPRISQTPVSIKDCAGAQDREWRVRDDFRPQKGLTKRLRFGEVADAALLIEGSELHRLVSRWTRWRMVTQGAGPRGDQHHHHFDHTLGKIRFMAARVCQSGRTRSASRMMEFYPKWQAQDLATFLSPWEPARARGEDRTASENMESDVEG